MILTPPSSPAEVDGHESGSRRRGRLKVKRERAKAYKRIPKLERSLDKKCKEADKYRKRYERLRKRISNSPRSELDRTLKGHDVPNRVKRQLLFSNIVVKDIQEKMRKSSNERKKQLISRIASGKLIRHYKLMGLAKTMHISYKRLRSNERYGNNLIFCSEGKEKFDLGQTNS